MILLLVSFIAGVLTILAPCTLPLLPVIVGSSVSRRNDTDDLDTAHDEHKKIKSQRFKAFTIASSLAASVVLFTLILKFSTALIHVPPYTWTLISGSIIIVFGLISVFPSVWDKIPGVASLNTKSNRMLGVGYKKKGIVGDIIIGASLGPIFSTCSPTYFVILATVLPQSFFLGLVYLIAYAVGLAGMIMLVSILGQKLVDRLGGLSDTHGKFKKILGIIFIALGILILAGVDKIVERKLLESGIFDITKIEHVLLELDSEKDEIGFANNVSPELSSSSSSDIVSEDISPELIHKDDETQVSIVTATSKKPVVLQTTSTVSPKLVSTRRNNQAIAPELVGISGYINTGGKEIKIADYKGNKIILLDVWTYSCINCQRTLPYINAWYEKYKDQGFEVIGLHTPEFGFEKVKSNVEKAVEKFGIAYPVVLDNAFSTWNAYGNRYWPRKYLINQYGEIIYDHIGEGNYEETEMEIQKALAGLHAEKKTTFTSDGIGANNLSNPSNKIVVDQSKVQSPEVYFGYNRNSLLANGKSSINGVQNLSLPASTNIISNKLYLGGTWNFESEYASINSKDNIDSLNPSNSTNPSRPAIVFSYNAKNVYMVLSGGSEAETAPSTVAIYIDGIKTKTITVQDNQLYTIVEGAQYGVHTVELRVESGTLNAYTFTFG